MNWGHLSVPDRFQQVLAEVPNGREVFRSSEGALTYEELDRASGHLASAIEARLGAGARQPVALFLPHSASVFIGIMGVLRAGHIYVPLDTGQSTEFLTQVLEDCTPAVLVTTAPLESQIRALAGPTIDIVVLDTLARAEPWEHRPGDASGCAAILYTSGSTGRPKGVQRSHASFVMPALRMLEDGWYEAGDRIAWLGSYALAMSGRSLYGSMLTGSTAIGANIKTMSTRQIHSWLLENRIRQYSAPPGIFRALGAMEDPLPLPDLRTVMVSLEPIARKDVEAFQQRLAPQATLYFILGATEGGSLSIFPVKPGEAWQGDVTPAGYADRDVRLQIVDEDLHPVADGVIGQIVVSGPSVSLGYWNRPEETEKKFSVDTQGNRVYYTGDLGRMTNGLLEHRGRMDFMLKIRGYRVEPVMIEQALTKHAGVAEALVTSFRDSRGGNAQLVAYCVLTAGSAAKPMDLREFLEAKLPAYMIPARILLLDAMPLNQVNKIDRKALPPPGSSRPDLRNPFVSPRNEDETKLSAIWALVLDLDEVGVDDNFFQLGGDSLSALEMVHRVEQLYSRPFPAPFYDLPTIANLARLIHANLEHEIEINASAPVRKKLVHRALVATYQLASVLGLGGAFFKASVLVLPAATRIFSRFLPTGPAVLTSVAAASRLLNPEANHTAIARRALEIVTFHSVWGLELEYLRPQHRNRALRWEGAEQLIAARQSGRPVMMVSYHSHSHRLTKELLKKLGMARVGIFPLRNDSDRSVTAARNTRILKAAEEALRRGDVVQIFPDGDRGTRAVQKPFLGGTREFLPGFAELAVRENAVVVPVSVVLRRGIVRITVEPAFQDTSGDPSTRVDRMVDEYAAYLERRWRMSLADSQSSEIRRYLRIMRYSAVR